MLPAPGMTVTGVRGMLRGCLHCSKEPPPLVLGEPGEAVRLPQRSIAVVHAHTPVQLVNDAAHNAVALIVGAPPVQGQAEYLPGEVH
jgi:hypothetical protein